MLKFHYESIDPQIPKPMIKYSAAKIYNVFAVLGEFFFIKSPIIVNTIGGPIIINNIKKIKPPKFPTSNAIMS